MAAGVYQHPINKFVLVARSIFLLRLFLRSYTIRGGIYGFTICHRRFKFQSFVRAASHYSSRREEARDYS